MSQIYKINWKWQNIIVYKLQKYTIKMYENYIFYELKSLGLKKNFAVIDAQKVRPGLDGFLETIFQMITENGGESRFLNGNVSSFMDF